MGFSEKLGGLSSSNEAVCGPPSSPFAAISKQPLIGPSKQLSFESSPGPTNCVAPTFVGSYQCSVAALVASVPAQPNLPLGLPVALAHNSSKRKADFSNEFADGPKRGVSLSHSPLKQLGPSEEHLASAGSASQATFASDFSELDDHITLAVLKARRAKSALRTRQSPRKSTLVDACLVSASADLPHGDFSLLSKSGMVVGPQSPPVGQ